MPHVSPAPLDALKPALEQAAQEFDLIDSERREVLKTIAVYVRRRLEAGDEARLTFICTHNSRRSHMAQLWAQAAAAHYGVAPVATFSGGTEATAFDRRAVRALQESGFEITTETEGANPRVQARYAEGADPLVCFSKRYDEDPNPREQFAAVMVCDSADAGCPVVVGADARIAVPFLDPKEADNSPEEARIYLERSRQIAREMMFAFSEV